jgi:hypothetical protein
VAAAVRPRPALGRGTAALVGVLDAALAVAVPLGVLAAVALLDWAAAPAPRPGWSLFAAAAGTVWLIGHGVDVRFAVPGIAAPFWVTVAALGPALVTLLAAIRSGRRLAGTAAPGLGLAAGVLATAAAGGVLAALVTRPEASPSLLQSALLPALVQAVGLAIGLGAHAARPLAGAGTALRAGLRLGAGSVAALLAVSALTVTALLLLSLPSVVGLAESLSAGPAGGLALTALQVTLLPTVVVWAASWIAGPGFAVGAGSSVSPLGTAAGPLPSLPLLGALPHQVPAVALAVVAVPVVAAFVLALLLPGDRPRGAAVLAAVAVAAASAGLLLGLLAAAASGAAGPGRLQTVGPDPLLVGLAVAAEVGIGALLGLACAPVRREAGR